MSESEYKFDADSEGDSPLFPIRTVSSLTGVNSITLRAWENRYGLIKPVRTPSGHRLYSREDIDVISKAVSLIKKGASISQAAEYLKNPARSPLGGDSDRDNWREYRQRVLDAVSRFDEAELEAIYQQALSVHPVQSVTRFLVVPSLKELGRRWQITEGGIAEEHFFSAFLRNKLGARFHHRGRYANGPLLIDACFPGEIHEAGLLLFALAADEHNYRQVLLGGNMPLDQLPPAIQRAGADGVVLSGKKRLERKIIVNDLPALTRRAGIPVFVGGNVAVYQSRLLKEAGCIVIGDDIDKGLSIIGDHLKRTDKQ